MQNADKPHDAPAVVSSYNDPGPEDREIIGLLVIAFVIALLGMISNARAQARPTPDHRLARTVTVSEQFAIDAETCEIELEAHETALASVGVARRDAEAELAQVRTVLDETRKAAEARLDQLQREQRTPWWERAETWGGAGVGVLVGIVVSVVVAVAP